MTEETKRRKPNTASIDRVIKAITEGSYDESLSVIEAAIRNRRLGLQEQILEQVRRVYGDEAEIVVPDVKISSPAYDKPNPFVRKAEREATQESEEVEEPAPKPVTEATADEIDENQITGDALDGIDGAVDMPMNEIERRMASGEAITEIENRGAIISGLSSSQMGDK